MSILYMRKVLSDPSLKVRPEFFNLLVTILYFLKSRKEHIISVLKKYPGGMIIVSHEEGFIQEIDVDNFYTIVNGELKFGNM